MKRVAHGEQEKRRSVHPVFAFFIFQVGLETHGANTWSAVPERYREGAGRKPATGDRVQPGKMEPP